MSALVRSSMGSGGGHLAVAVRPATKGFSNFIGSGGARLYVGIARGPGGLITGIGGGAIGLVRMAATRSFLGNRGIC